MGRLSPPQLGGSSRGARILSKRSIPLHRPAKRYASSSYVDPEYLQNQQDPADARVDRIRQVLYPVDAYAPKSTSPTGAHHPQNLERVHAILQHPEVHETIERAWKLHARLKKEAQERSLKARYEAMVEACEELNIITKPRKGEDGQVKESLYPRALYTKAMEKPDPDSLEKLRGRRATPLSRWQESRLDGFFPRDSWVPTETKGKPWNYSWRRPKAD